MKKYGLIMVTTLLVLGGCASAPVVYTVPFQASVSFPAAGEYEILGRVSLVLPADSAGYGMLLEQARNQFPLADDVVNVLVDREDVYDGNENEPTLLSSTYHMTGLAIRYLADFPREPVAAPPALPDPADSEEAGLDDEELDEEDPSETPETETEAEAEAEAEELEEVLES